MKPANQVTDLLNCGPRSDFGVDSTDARLSGGSASNPATIPARSSRFERLLQFVKFCMVGGSGLFVDMGILYLLADPKTLAWNIALSKICAAEIAMINNFVWNEFWTFRQRALPLSGRMGDGLRVRAGIFHRFAIFNVFCGIGIAFAVLLLHLFHTLIGWNLYLSNLLAITLVTFWNFGMNARFNWPSEKRFHFLSVLFALILLNTSSQAPFVKANESAASEPQESPTLARLAKSSGNDGMKSLSGCCHILLFYGRGRTDLPYFTSGEVALQALTDEQAAITTFGTSPFVRTRRGLRYLLAKDPVFNSDVGESHQDQCLAAFAFLDLPLATPIRLRSSTLSISDLLSESIANFSFDQRELAWTASAFAKYIPPKDHWVNRFGEGATFSNLSQHLLHLDLRHESCGGTHVLHALIQITRSDRSFSILDKRTRQYVDAYVKSRLSEIVRNQHRDGSWGNDWSDRGSGENAVPAPFATCFLLTGHILEILNSLTADQRGSDLVYLRAAEWLRSSLNSTNILPDGSWVCPFTHAARSVRDQRQYFPVTAITNTLHLPSTRVSFGSNPKETEKRETKTLN